VTGSLIVGLGREGLALARFLRDSEVDVTVCDGRTAADLGTVYVNPAVPKEAPIVQAALLRGIPVSALTDVFFDICPASIVGITGSSGKTTTTTILGLMLQAGGLVTYVGGNIGRPLLNEAMLMQPSDWVVLEMSSFQLEWLESDAHGRVTPQAVEKALGKTQEH